MLIVNYYFLWNEFVDFYVGLGIGVLIDNIDVGVFNEGYKLYFVVVL